MPQLRIPKKLIVPFLLLAAVGFADSSYLTAEHLRGVVPPCSLTEGCDAVLSSQFAEVAGIPVAALGLGYYALLIVLMVAYLDVGKRTLLHWAAWLTTVGLLASAYLVAVQVFVIRALCLYCLISAATSVGLFVIGTVIMRRD